MENQHSSCRKLEGVLAMHVYGYIKLRLVMWNDI